MVVGTRSSMVSWDLRGGLMQGHDLDVVHVGLIL